MADIAIAGAYRSKAGESLAGAEIEFAGGRYNNAANRCSYACFQAAIAALVQHGIEPTQVDREWRHTFVHSQFIGQLINRRKVYPETLRPVLADAQSLREKADYKDDPVSEREARRALGWARAVVAAVIEGGERL